MSRGYLSYFLHCVTFFGRLCNQIDICVTFLSHIYMNLKYIIRFSKSSLFVQYQPKPDHFRLGQYSCLLHTISQSFIESRSKTKENYSQDIFCKQPADTFIQFSQKPHHHSATYIQMSSGKFLVNNHLKLFLVMTLHSESVISSSWTTCGYIISSNQFFQMIPKSKSCPSFFAVAHE